MKVQSATAPRGPSPFLLGAACHIDYIHIVYKFGPVHLLDRPTRPCLWRCRADGACSEVGEGSATLSNKGEDHPSSQETSIPLHPSCTCFFGSPRVAFDSGGSKSGIVGNRKECQWLSRRVRHGSTGYNASRSFFLLLRSLFPCLPIRSHVMRTRKRFASVRSAWCRRASWFTGIRGRRSPLRPGPASSALGRVASCPTGRAGVFPRLPRALRSILSWVSLD